MVNPSRRCKLTDIVNRFRPVDIHDRRPVVLSADDARMWINLEIPAVETDRLARYSSLPPGAFERFAVTRDVNIAGNQTPHMVESIETVR